MLSDRKTLLTPQSLAFNSQLSTKNPQPFGNFGRPAVFESLAAHGILDNMKRMGKVAVCLAGMLALNAGLHAGDGVSPDNPYASVVARNVFGLNPITATTNNTPDDAQVPKITPNGIMSIFGQLQVLFKVAVPAKPGQPAKDESYILSEGQRQDDIEVVQIDEKSSVVTFNNHGIVQELPLAKVNAPAISTPAPGPGRPFSPNASPNVDTSRNPARFGSHSAGAAAAAMRNRGRGGGSDGSQLTAVPTRAGYPGQAAGQPSDAAIQQAILLEAQRAAWQGRPEASMIPPTALTPQLNPEASAEGSTPPVP
jgi:hypothetical protein